MLKEEKILLDKKSSGRAKAAIVSGMILFPSWCINDYLFAPEMFVQFAWIRGIETLSIMLIYWFFSKGKISHSQAIDLVFYPICIEVAYMCNVVNEEALIPFYLGYTTLYAATFVVVLIPFKKAMLYYLAGVLSFVLFFIVLEKHSVETHLEQGGFLFLTVSFFASLFVLFDYRSVLKEIKTSVKLDQSNHLLSIKNEEIEQTHLLLENQHKEMKDSINYAKRIQEALMPRISAIREVFNDSFLIYQPKDIVAGDFYWLESNKDNVYFAVADCTGHGVPGAMVSVVCLNSLNKVLLDEDITEPAKILDRTREIIVQRFSKSGDEVYDGMDIILCKLNKITKVLSYAGAYNPLWLVRKNEMDFEVFKADKQAIGKSNVNTPFSQRDIQLNSGDEIYLTTDGFQDQFGGPKGKKLMSKRLKQFIIANQGETMKEQGWQLRELFGKWKGGQEQVDDVCMLGIRV